MQWNAVVFCSITNTSCVKRVIRKLDRFFLSHSIFNTIEFDPHLHGPPIHTSLDVRSLNRMISDFSKTGDLISAQRVFDEMPHRDVVSWNSIMAAHARSNNHEEVLRILSRMHFYGLNANHTSISTALSSCAKLQALNQGEQIHALSMKTCSSANVFVGSAFITMYSKCGVLELLVRAFDDIDCPSVASWNALLSGFVSNRRVSDAHRIFYQMPSKNVVSWTALLCGYIEVKNIRKAMELFDSMPVQNSVSWAVMLGGLTNDGQYEVALELFTTMIYRGVQANAMSLMKVISACAGLQDPKQGRKIHGYVIKFGFHLEKTIEASLISMYCECLDIEEAKLEFDKMQRNFIGSWNSLLCGYINKNRVDEARMLFDSMKERDMISWNSMINGYLRSKRIDDATELFSQIPEPTLETVTALMSNFIDNGRLYDAKKLFDMMPHGDVMAYTTLIYGYMKEGLLENAFEIFERMAERNAVTYNVMISGLLQHGKVTEAYKLFNESPERNTSSWNALVIGFVQNKKYHEAFALYNKMMMSDASLNEQVLASLLSASAKLPSLIHGEQLHASVIKLGHEAYTVVGNSLINMYGKCGKMLLARFIFEMIHERDVATWNSIIIGYAFNGLGTDAIGMFENMRRTSIKPDDVTFLGVLAACNHKCFLGEAYHYFSSMRIDYGMVPSLAHYACIIDLLSRMGMTKEAEKLVYSMPYQPDSVIWTSLLTGCRSSFNIKLAEHAVNQLVAWDPKDTMPYLHLINIYESAGIWDAMGNLRNQVKKMGSRKQPGRSWIETYNHVRFD